MHSSSPSKPSVTRLSDEEVALLDETSLASSDMESDNDPSRPHELANYFQLQEAPSRLKSCAVTWMTASLDALRLMPIRHLLVRVALFLVPSFLQGRHAREQFLRPSHKLAPTAYLDGIRGLAALFVFFCHYSYQAFTIAKSWGTDQDNRAFLKLPFVRIWYQGPAAVCVFFVISGYALSYKPLKLIRSQNTLDFSTTVSSLTFRRAIRLYLPTATSTFLIACLLQLGLYELTREFATDRTYMKHVMEPHPEMMESAYAQFRDWAWKMFEFVCVFDWGIYSGQPSYDVHLWTIPVEFRCSLYLFLVIIGTARLRTNFRLLTIACVFCLVYRNSRWDLCLFLCGMVLAESDHIRGAHKPAPALPTEEEKTPGRPCRRRLMSFFWASASILGLYLLCQPDEDGDRAPGWIFLTSLIPKWWLADPFRYWESVGAVIFVLAVGHSAGWQRFFNSGPIQYLGKISYALYLMHTPAMHCVGYHWEKWAYRVTGTEGYWFNAGFALGTVFVVPTVIWWADVFWRAVDIPAVKLARWIEQRCIVKK